MLINTEQGLKLSNEKVIFEKDGVEEEKIIGSEGKEWWTELATKKDNINIISFGVVVYEQDVIDRFDEIKDVDVDFGLAEQYVLNGETNGKLTEIILKKQVVEQDGVIADLTQLLVDKGVIY